MAETVFNRFKAALANADDDWVTGDMRTLLVSGSVTIDPDDVSVADFIAAGSQVELTDGSYARVALTSEAVAQDDTNDRANLNAATIDYGALDNETPTAMLVYKHVDGTNANDLCVAVFDTGFGDPSNGAGYTITSTNIIRIS